MTYQESAFGDNQGKAITGVLAAWDEPDAPIPCETVSMWQTNEGRLIVEHVSLEMAELADGEPFVESHSRVRVLRSMNDVWTFFDRQSEAWVLFLRAIANELGDPTLFWQRVN